MSFTRPSTRSSMSSIYYLHQLFTSEYVPLDAEQVQSDAFFLSPRAA